MSRFAEWFTPERFDSHTIAVEEGRDGRMPQRGTWQESRALVISHAVLIFNDGIVLYSPNAKPDATKTIRI